MPIDRKKMQEINEKVINLAKTDAEFAKILHKDPWKAVKMCCDSLEDKTLSKEDLASLKAGFKDFAFDHSPSDTDFLIELQRALNEGLQSQTFKFNILDNKTIH